MSFKSTGQASGCDGMGARRNMCASGCLAPMACPQYSKTKQYLLYNVQPRCLCSLLAHVWMPIHTGIILWTISLPLTRNLGQQDWVEALANTCYSHAAWTFVWLGSASPHSFTHMHGLARTSSLQANIQPLLIWFLRWYEFLYRSSWQIRITMKEHGSRVQCQKLRTGSAIRRVSVPCAGGTLASIFLCVYFLSYH